MVGGFSFYERAEIKDMLSYLKLVQNPHDSIALQRVINTPVRGIGRSTLDTLERLALETGTSTWDAIGHAVRQDLLPQRALNALEAFQRIIDDAHAMLEPGFAEKLAADVAGASLEVVPEGGYAQSPDAEDEGAEEEGSFDDGTGFAFGAQGMLDLSHAEPEDESSSPEVVRRGCAPVKKYRRTSASIPSTMSCQSNRRIVQDDEETPPMSLGR